MGPFYVDLFLDNSTNPKIPEIRIMPSIIFCFIWMFISSIIIIIVSFIAPLFVNSESQVLLIMLLTTLISVIPIFISIFKATRRQKEYNKKLVQGTMVVTPINNQCIGIFRSNYKELATINIDKIVHNGGRIKTKTNANNHICRIIIENERASINYFGREICCALKLETSDVRFINLLQASGVLNR